MENMLRFHIVLLLVGSIHSFQSPLHIPQLPVRGLIAGRASVGVRSAEMTPFTSEHLSRLSANGWVAIEDFVPPSLVSDIRKDVMALRSEGRFKVAGVGQDSTNAVVTAIRKAETCFIFPKLDPGVGVGSAREKIYNRLATMSAALSGNDALGPLAVKLDDRLNEALYAYYPTGGYYRRHKDAVSGSASVLRTWSYLLYLNDDWSEGDGGELRIHLDQGGDSFEASPACPTPQSVDIAPKAGTLVLFKSDAIPHEVLDTAAERLAVVGWFNRGVSASDLGALSGSGSNLRTLSLALAAGLVTSGVVSIMSTLPS